MTTQQKNQHRNAGADQMARALRDAKALAYRLPPLHGDAAAVLEVQIQAMEATIRLVGRDPNRELERIKTGGSQ